MDDITVLAKNLIKVEEEGEIPCSLKKEMKEEDEEEELEPPFRVDLKEEFIAGEGQEHELQDPLAMDNENSLGENSGFVGSCLYIDVFDTVDHAKIRLVEIQRTISFNNGVYGLIGIVNYIQPINAKKSEDIMGHYTTLCPQNDDTWIECDGLKAKPIQRNKLFEIYLAIIVFARKIYYNIS